MISSFEIVDKRIVPSATGDGPILLVTEPTNEERSRLQSDLQLDDFDFGSMLDPDEVPRVELTPDRTVLIWKLPESAAMSGEIELAVSVAGIVLAREQLVLVRRAGGVRFDEREFRRVADAKDVLLSFLLGTVHHFVAHLRVIKQISSELELKITTSMENKYLLQMFSLSESLVYYLDGIEGNAAALARLKSLAREIGFEKRHLDALDDLTLECAQAARQANIYTSVLSGLMDARGTIVNNNMNILLKNLTLINIVFLPLNLIASIGGMSEWSMMTDGMDWRLSYGLFSVGMLLIGWITWLGMNQIINRSSQRVTRQKQRKLRP